MAILNSIRKRGIFLIIIIAMALFAFVISGIIDNGGLKGGTVSNSVATVNGTDIDRVAFNNLVEAQSRQYGGAASQSQVRNIVWEQQVRKAIIEGKLEELGFSAESNFTRNALTNAFQNQQEFFNEAGVFDYAKLEEYIRFQQENDVTYANWLAQENQIVSQAMEQAYLNMIQGSASPSTIDGKWEYHLENDKVDIQFVQVPYSSIPDDQAVITDAEIEAYMRDHQDRFTVDPRVDIQYVLFAGNASAADELATTEEVNQLVNDTINGLAITEDVEALVNANSEVPYQDRFLFKNQVPSTIVDSIFAREAGSVYGPYKERGNVMATRIVERRTLPDSVKSRHILIPIGSNPTDNVVRDEAQARTTADSLLTILKSDLSRFEEFVTAYSSDVNSIPNGGLYDWYPYNRMTPVYRDFTFEEEVGSLDVVQSDYGFHIIEVLDQKNPQEVVKLATIAKPLRASQETINNLFSDATNFELAARKGDFAAVAQESVYGVRPVNAVGQLDENITGLGPQRTLVNWAFNEETAVGDIKRFDVGDGFAVVQLVRRNLEEALMSNAEGSAIVTPILRAQKKAKLIREQLSGSTLEEIAQSQSQTVQSAQAINRKSPTIAGGGTEPKVVGAAFGLKPGEVSGPIDGKTGVFVVRLTAKNVAPDLEDYSAFVARARQTQGTQAALNAYNALKKAADIEDNRATFY
ncbi:peptidylprolyl isomerase [Gilvibacter sp.]|uniref:peptidylprolyl isomerase n=1 Tax=Gilvibacter sp. TaxID=2729997 RepID=UPI003F4A0292